MENYSRVGLVQSNQTSLQLTGCPNHNTAAVVSRDNYHMQSFTHTYTHIHTHTKRVKLNTIIINFRISQLKGMVRYKLTIHLQLEMTN